jgi:hypothetical protein
MELRNGSLIEVMYILLVVRVDIYVNEEQLADLLLGLPTVPSTGTAIKKAAVFPKSWTRDGTGRQKDGRKRGRDGSGTEIGRILFLALKYCLCRHSSLL